MNHPKSLLRNSLTVNRKYFFAPMIVAAIMAYVSSRYLFVGSGLNLIPWGIIALLWGLVARSQHDAKYLGLTYGFSQAFIFLWVDQKGGINMAQFIALLVIIAVLGILAGMCSMVAAKLGYQLKARSRRQ